MNVFPYHTANTFLLWLFVVFTEQLMKSPGVWHHVYWGNYSSQINVIMSVELEPNFTRYEAMSVVYRNNRDLKQ